MNSNLIYKSQWFWGWDDEKEEAWLRKMANQGLHLVKIAGLARYAFRAGPPQDIVYRLDFFNHGQGDYKIYLQLCRDAGWELVGEFFSWQYFRKTVEQGEFPEILSDNESKIKKYQNLLFLIGGVSPVTILSLILLTEKETTPFAVIVCVIIILLCGFYAFCAANLLGRINRLKRL